VVQASKVLSYGREKIYIGDGVLVRASFKAWAGEVHPKNFGMKIWKTLEIEQFQNSYAIQINCKE